VTKDFSQPNPDFMYDEAIAQMRDILTERFDDAFPQRFMDAVEAVRANGVLIDDPEEAERIVQADLSADYPGVFLGGDGHLLFLFSLLRRREALRVVRETRFDRQGHVQTLLVPDGKGSYIVTQEGISGRWDVELACRLPGRVPNQALLRLIDNLSLATERLHTRQISLSTGIPIDVENFEINSVCVVDSLQQLSDYNTEGSMFYSVGDGRTTGIAVQVVPASEGVVPSVRVFVTSDFLLYRGLYEQRRVLREFFSGMHSFVVHRKGAEIPVQIPSARASVAGPVSPKPSMLLMRSARENLGHRAIRTALEQKRIAVEEASFSSKIQNAEELYVGGMPPRAVGLSVSDTELGKINQYVAAVRQHLPDSFIIAGGINTKDIKVLLATLDDADIVIRGEAEEVLPQVLEIIGTTTRREGLSEEQLRRLGELRGVWVRSDRHVVLGDLAYTNMVRDFDTPIIWNPQESRYDWNIARGCPYNCNFCQIFSGRAYRTASLEHMQRNVFEFLARHTCLTDATLSQLAGTLGTDLDTLQECAGLDYIPEETAQVSKGALVAVLGTLEAELGPFDRAALQEIVMTVTGESTEAVTQVSDVAQFLPEHIDAYLARRAILVLRREYVERLLREGRDLLEYGLFKQYQGKVPPRGFGMIRYPEPVTNAILSIFGLQRSDFNAGVLINHGRLPGFGSYNYSREQLVSLLDTFNRDLMPIDEEMATHIRGEIFGELLPMQPGEDEHITFGQLRARVQSLRKDVEVPGSLLFDLADFVKDRWVSDLYYQHRDDPYWSITRVDFRAPILSVQGDNALANRKFIGDFLAWFSDMGLGRYIDLSSGQNRIDSVLRNGVVDEETVSLLAMMPISNFGTDGVTPRIIQQNGKGYSFAQAMEVNAAIRKRKGKDWESTPRNNIQLTTPDSSILDVAESLFMQSCLRPFLGRRDSQPIRRIYFLPGASFSNENLALYPQRYTPGQGNIPGTAYPEYAYIGQIHLQFTDPRVGRVLQGDEYRVYIPQVVARWQSDDETDPQIRALGRIFRIYQDEGRLALFDIGKHIHDDMEAKEIYTYTEYEAHLLSGPAAVEAAVEERAGDTSS
jgi:hypothetical protein